MAFKLLVIIRYEVMPGGISFLLKVALALALIGMAANANGKQQYLVHLLNIASFFKSSFVVT